MTDQAMPAKVRLTDGLGLDAMRPVAWMRKHPDGSLTGEMLTDGAIEACRTASGAWEPLYRSAAIERVLQTARAFEAHRDEMYAELMFARRVLCDLMQTGVAQQTLWALRDGQGSNTKEGEAWLAAASFAKAAGEALKAWDEQA